MSKTMADLAHESIEWALDALDLDWETTWVRDPRAGSPCGVIVATVEGAVADGAVQAPRGWTVAVRTDDAVTTMTFSVDVDAMAAVERRIDAVAARAAIAFLEEGWCDEDGGARLCQTDGAGLAKAVGADGEDDVSREEWDFFVREVRRLMPPSVGGTAPDEDLGADEREERRECRAEYLDGARRALAESVSGGDA